MSQPLVIRIDFNVDDTPGSLEALLRRVAPVWSAAVPVTLDLGDCCYLGPISVVVLISILESRTTHGWSTTLVPPRLERLYGYCIFSGLLDRFGAGQAPDSGHARNETIPAAGFITADLHVLNPVIALVRRHIELGRGAEEALRIAISEVIQNVVDHANSPSGGLVSARAYSGEREVRIAIADLGVGVLATLRRTVPHLRSHAEALREAVISSRSARSTARNLGQGLTHIDSLMARNGGQLLLLSHSGMYVRNGRNARVHPLQHSYPGTIVCISFKVDNALYDDDIDDTDVW